MQLVLVRINGQADIIRGMPCQPTACNTCQPSLPDLRAKCRRVPENSGQTWGSIYPRDDLVSVAREICTQINGMQVGAGRGWAGVWEAWAPSSRAGWVAEADAAMLRQHDLLSPPVISEDVRPSAQLRNSSTPSTFQLQSAAQEQFNIVLTITTLTACEQLKPAEGNGAPAPAPASRRMLKA